MDIAVLMKFDVTHKGQRPFKSINLWKFELVSIDQ